MPSLEIHQGQMSPEEIEKKLERVNQKRDMLQLERYKLSEFEFRKLWNKLAHEKMNLESRLNPSAHISIN